LGRGSGGPGLDVGGRRGGIGQFPRVIEAIGDREIEKLVAFAVRSGRLTRTSAEDVVVAKKSPRPSPSESPVEAKSVPQVSPLGAEIGGAIAP
jgi:hypothetical protein